MLRPLMQRPHCRQQISLRPSLAKETMAAAKALAKDPDPQTTKALVQAVSDKSWVVRVGALQALAKRGDPAVLDNIRGAMSDDKDAVRYTASAAVIRLTNLQQAPKPEREGKQTKKKR